MPPDDALIELAAGFLLATCSDRATSETAASFRAAVNRLLARRGGLVEVGGETYVRAAILSVIMQQVTEEACERFRAALLPRFPHAERAVVARKLDVAFGRIAEAAERMFAESQVLH